MRHMDTSDSTDQADRGDHGWRMSWRNNPLLAFGVVGGITLGAITWAANYDPPPEPVDPLVERYDAERVCQDFARDRLKAPSTAVFNTSVEGWGPEYTVVGTVDAQNSFGAVLRETFTCTVRGNGATWNLVSLKGL